ncbi:MAG: hypothetical protein JXA33_04620, partial [Anaerolineae bacterium]|nr:hypothetical protein [Anaerolineae bacterium]
LLAHFLDATGSEVSIHLSQSSTLVQDPGILRATQKYLEPYPGLDEPERITPLLHAFLRDYVQPIANDQFSVEATPLLGEDYTDPPRNRDIRPRPWDFGWFGAIGHVYVDGTFSANGHRACNSDKGYILEYQADYSIADTYEWFLGKATPMPFPGVHPAPGTTCSDANGPACIPHEWAISLMEAVPRRAAQYDFTISWTEKEKILVAPDFSEFRSLAWWEQITEE